MFYSISNTQRGLGGISFGNFLIKQVVEELRRELPKLDTFVTLSPVPNFMQWLREAGDVPVTEEERELLKQLDDPKWFEHEEVTAQLRAVVEPLAAHYFLRARNPKGRVIDSVARFHLGNGARLERIDWLGDLSRERPARIRRHHGQLSLSPRRHRGEPRGLRQQWRGGGLLRGEEAAEGRAARLLDSVRLG